MGAMPSPTARVKLASSRDEIMNALKLTYDEYLANGLCSSNPWRIRVTNFHTIPTTDIAIALDGKKVVCTISLVLDSEFGLPMEDAFSNEVNALRRQGASLAEISSLAYCRKHQRKSFALLRSLMSFTAHWSATRSVDYPLIAVHPKHVAFYKKFLGFEVIGAEKPCPAVKYQPGVPLKLDLAHLKNKNAKGYERLFGTRFPASSFDRPKNSEAILTELRILANQTPGYRRAAA